MEAVNLTQIENTYFTPQICNLTTENAVYQVLYERKLQLHPGAGTDGIDEILGSFPIDLIDDHSLCVEFSDVFDVLYITVDSSPITGEFYDKFSTIELDVTNEVEAVISVRVRFSLMYC